MVDPDARTTTLLALSGNRLETVPRTDGGMILASVMAGLSKAPTAVFMGITGLSGAVVKQAFIHIRGFVGRAESTSEVHSGTPRRGLSPLLTTSLACQ